MLAERGRFAHFSPNSYFASIDCGWKVRCDRANPCSNCVAIKGACRFSPKHNDNRQRILISSRYENKVESIDERLAGIEKSLQTLIVNMKTTPAQSAVVDGPTPLIKPALNSSTLSRTPKDRLDVTETFEGGTSLKAHSLHAKGLFETLSSSTSAKRSARLRDALTSLQNTLKAESDPAMFYDLRFTSEREMKFTSISDLEMPPMQAVLEVLRAANEKLPHMFLEAPMFEVTQFSEMCKNLYFCTTDYSPALFTIVNAGLAHLFAQGAFEKEGSAATEWQRYAYICGLNFELTMENLTIFLAPSLESCQALICGAYYACEIAKASLCQRLTTIAAQMCQALGYHRLPATKVETKELRAKKTAFWGVYSLDKALSLRLGCTSVLQDDDISTTVPSYPEDPKMHSWHTMFIAWINFARFQGEAYSLLYTAKALNAPLSEKMSRIERLAAEIQEWREGTTEMKEGNTLYPEIFDMNLDSMDVVAWGVLSIIYRAVPPSVSDISPNFNTECISAARKALDLHRAAASRFHDNNAIWQGYVNWTLLYSPFAPFMIVFCEAVTTLNLVDLSCLAEFVSSIAPNEETINKGAQRLFHLCSAFYQVAKIYIEESLDSASKVPIDNTNAVNVAVSDQNASFLAPQPQRGYAGFDTAGSSWQQGLGGMDGLGGNTANGPNGFLGVSGVDNYLGWSTEDWSMPDMYMMGIIDGSIRGGPTG
ncbi:hypothetical protein BP6252_08797 [Coleophoma cylindrospora]|uniref:Xylanolytic transcriptional activator regulatory domain-containing protein n=1 Tax=Coleophoma cylindrospora TaxID=1849047 RepID=A0A3D8R702_9HELO|nr:hypothetical protein BP6252_08797 [Coleophoma cylindrospora]